MILAPNSLPGTIVKGASSALNSGVKTNANASFFMGASLISPSAATTAASGISTYTTAAVDSND
jgi:hypothetical protein